MLTVVMYHYVRDIRQSRYPEIKGLETNLFRKQLAFLSRYYTFIRMEDLAAALSGQHKLPKKSVLLTFDDAYLDHYTQVFPLLDEMNIQGSFFVPTCAVREGKLLNVNRIHYILASADIKELLAEIKATIEHFSSHDHNIMSFEDYYLELAVENRFDPPVVIFVKRLLQHSLPYDIREEMGRYLFKRFVRVDEAVFAKELYMSEAQCKTMLRHGMHIGGHGYDHFWLDHLDRHDQEKEIQKSKAFLDEIGVPDIYKSFAYPYGAYNEDSIELLSNNGFRVAFTTKVATIKKLNALNPFEVPRLDTNDLPKKADAPPNQWYYYHGQ